MALVGVISDTHGRLDPAAYAALADCDHIIHAGDIGDPEILRELETLAPVTAVLGNNDYYEEYGKDVSRFATPCIEGVHFLVSHYPKDVRIRGLGNPALAPGDPIPQICIHGHTHLAKLLVGAEASPAQYVLCPGSAYRPRSGWPRTVAHIEIHDGTIARVQVEDLHGKVLLFSES